VRPATSDHPLACSLSQRELKYQHPSISASLPHSYSTCICMRNIQNPLLLRLSVGSQTQLLSSAFTSNCESPEQRPSSVFVSFQNRSDGFGLTWKSIAQHTNSVPHFLDDQMTVSNLQPAASVSLYLRLRWSRRQSEDRVSEWSGWH
jgi:hypothetical protein